MILTLVKLNTLAGKRKELWQTLQSIVAQMKMEEGCVDSSFYQQAEDENEFLLIGEWENPEALNDYLRSIHFKVLMGAKSLLSRPLEIAIHTVAQSSELNPMHPKI